MGERFSAGWRRVGGEHVDWLARASGDEGTTGFPTPDRPELPDSAWVLHAMYEHRDGPGSISHHAAWQAELAAGTRQPEVIGGIDLDAESELTVTGGELGRADHPGPEWRWLWWSQLTARTGDPLVSPDALPSFRCFPRAKSAGGSWPVGILPPAEGCPDRASWEQLVALLVAWSPRGAAEPCLAYYHPFATGEWDAREPHALAGRLGDAASLYEHPEYAYTPANLWPADRSWLVRTDYDLCGERRSQDRWDSSKPSSSTRSWRPFGSDRVVRVRGVLGRTAGECGLLRRRGK